MPNQMTLKYLTSNKMFLNINQCGYWSENCKFSFITPLERVGYDDGRLESLWLGTLSIHFLADP